MFKDRKPCEACDGKGILFGRFRLVPPVENEKEGSVVMSDVKTRYYPERQVKSVRIETLELWKRELEEKIVALQTKILQYGVGIAEIDQELEERNSRKHGKASP